MDYTIEVAVPISSLRVAAAPTASRPDTDLSSRLGKSTGNIR